MDTSTVGIAGTVLGTVIGVLAGYYTATRVTTRQEFNKAAAVFRAAFTKEIRIFEGK